MAHQQYCTLLFYNCLIILYSVFDYYCAQSYTFTKQPKSVLVGQGNTVELSCEWRPALNENHVVYWVAYPHVGGAQAIDRSTLKYNLTTIATSAYLSIFNVDYKDVGNYRCDISEGGGLYSLSEFASVVLGEILCDPKNGLIGTTLTCSYFTSYYSRDIDLLWYKDRKQITSKVQQNNVIKSRALTADDDRAVFTCKATIRSQNQVIGTCETTPLSIDAKIEQSPPGSLQVGDSFNLTCSGKGNPDYYKYEWTWSGYPVGSSPNERQFAIGNVLTVMSVTSSANGKNATCTISRSGRNSSTASYTINVLENIWSRPTTQLQTTPGRRTQQVVTYKLLPTTRLHTTRLQSTRTQQVVTDKLLPTTRLHTTRLHTTRLESTRMQRIITDQLSATNISSADEPPTLMVVISVLAISLVVSVILIIYMYLQKRNLARDNTIPSKRPSTNIGHNYDYITSTNTHVTTAVNDIDNKYDYAVYPCTRNEKNVTAEY